ncbi:MAG: hypothetical protein IT441_08515 [Phycisphaeraceae bacterium]|nr:hypothetical protein [Phycisphaeraceae bacterium]
MNAVPSHHIPMRTVVLGWAWALALMLLGLTLWLAADHDGPTLTSLLTSLGLVCLCGAHFIFLVLVADHLCPHAPDRFRLACQGAAGLLTWMSMIWAAWLAVDTLQRSL